MATLNPNNATVHGIRRFNIRVAKSDSLWVPYTATLLDRADNTRETFTAFTHKGACKAAWKAASDILFNENAARSA